MNTSRSINAFRLNPILRTSLLGSLLALGMISVPTYAGGLDIDLAIRPPVVRIEAAPEIRAGFIWAPGYWGWEGRRHIWHPGHHIAERPGYRWEPDRWETRGNRYHFVAGRWNAEERREERHEDRREDRHDDKHDKIQEKN